MKITSHSFLAFFSVAVATVSAVLLISSLRGATTHAPSTSGLAHENPSTDSTEQQTVLAPTTQIFDAMSKSGDDLAHRRQDIPLVRIDNDLAVVWAPFEFLVDGKVDHCGTDLFNLVRVDGQWIIASVADTGRKDCAHK